MLQINCGRFFSSRVFLQRRAGSPPPYPLSPVCLLRVRVRNDSLAQTAHTLAVGEPYPGTASFWLVTFARLSEVEPVTSGNCFQSGVGRVRNVGVPASPKVLRDATGILGGDVSHTWSWEMSRGYHVLKTIRLSRLIVFEKRAHIYVLCSRLKTRHF